MELTEEESGAMDTEVTASETSDKAGEVAVEIKKEERKPCLRTLNGLDKNVIIDLTSGLIKPRKLTGPELLYQKFLKTQAKPKVNKDKVCMNILSMENGKLGIQRVEVKLDKQHELDHNRPGYSREKLKQNLRKQIVQKRLEIIKTKGLKSEYEPEEKCKSDGVTNKENKQNSDTSDEEYDPEAEEDEEEEAESGEEDIACTKQKKKPVSAFIDNEVGS
jgi:hypothetical protein